MQRKALGYFVLPLLLLLSNSSGDSAPSSPGKSTGGETGTLEKMIVANGNVEMDLDLNRLNGTASPTKEAKLDTLRFQVGPDSFFTLLVFNGSLRGPEPGTMGLVPANTAAVPTLFQASLNQLVIEKLARMRPLISWCATGKPVLSSSTLREISMSTIPRRMSLGSTMAGCWFPKLSRTPWADLRTRE